VQEIAAASEEQTSGVGQISTAMNQLSDITQQNASASEELAATAEEMSGQAEQLQQLMAFFKVDGGLPPSSTRKPKGRSRSMPDADDDGSAANGLPNGFVRFAG